MDEPRDQTEENRPETQRGRRIAAAIGGIVSGAFGLGVAEVVAGSNARFRSPVLDVGDRVIDRVPVALKDLAIELFGTNDKIALLVGIGTLLAAYAATLGILMQAGRHRLAIGGVVLFGIAGSLAALGARGGTDILTPLPSIVGATAAGVTLVAGARMLTREADDSPRETGRRDFLIAAGAFTVAAAALGATGRWLTSRFSAAESRAAITLPPPELPRSAIPATTQARSAAPFITPNADFYRIDTALTVPQVPTDGWDLTVTGLVDRDLRLSYDDILSRDLVEADITLTCVSNTVGGDLIGNARWLGIRLDDLLADAGIDPTADQIVGRSVDGYTCGFPVAALDGRDALVAIGMNGEPLPLEHGFPARLIVPGIYGYASATKWLSEIELTTYDAFDHYWVERGYAAKAPIKLQSRIDAPRGLDRIPAGPFVIGGVAWAQTVGIDAVELRIDDGDWEPAILADELTDTTWRQWSFPWDATPGRHSVSVRATDRNGQVQTDARVEPLPDGATGHHTVVVLVGDA